MDWLIGFLDRWYDWLKAFHLIAVIAWMAGLLYLPRLYVYHATAEAGSALAETFKVMERRLLRGIMNPAFVLVWTLGLLLAWTRHWWPHPWFHAKLALVIALSILHHLLAWWRKGFEADRNTRSPRFYRVVNELPAVLMVGIVVLVIVKPF